MPAYTPTQWDALLERQQWLEDTCLSKGAERFKKRLLAAQENGTESTTGAAKRLLTGGLATLEASLDAFINPPVKRGGTRHVAEKWVRMLGVETTAFMVLKTILDRIEHSIPVTQMSREIADVMFDELRYRRFKEIAPALYTYKLAHFQTNSYAYMARSLDASIRFLKCIECQKHCEKMSKDERKAFICPHLSGKFDDLTISATHRLLLGTKLIDFAIRATGLVEVVAGLTLRKTRKNRIKRSLSVRATPETLEWLRARNNKMQWLSPVTLPMVVPPLQWESGQRGGYRFGLRNKYSLVRSSPDILLPASMPRVYQALNAIQNTAWKINRRVLDTIDIIAQRGGGRAGVPLMEQILEPPKPDDIDTNEEAKKRWKKSVVKTYEANNTRTLRVMEYSRTVDTARTIRDDAAIFFPFNLDFRGRIYPVCSFLSPQGDDLSKGLLTFADGKPIGESGARWLAIHGANCMDTAPGGQKMSKMTLDERVAWVHANSERIQRVALEPCGELEQWWSAADAPLQFLAFCFEWESYLRHGAGYVCSLPVSIDGSCNGLQHFSAMLRDHIGGAAVNVIPQARPQDIYHHVAEHVLSSLGERHKQGDNLATLWLTSGLVDRKLAKRPTMTFGYGSKVFGFQTQLLDYLKGLQDESGRERYTTIRQHFMQDDGDEHELVLVEACGLMSQLIWDALQDIVIAASQGMQWLQKSARAIVGNGGGTVKWVVPGTGFPVEQPYYALKSREIRTVLAGRVIKPRVHDQTNTVETYKQVNSIAPNIVHSLDAAALMLTITRAMDEGVESFAAIHDSYGTVPADMSVLARATRQSFVQLYTEHDVIGDLFTQFTQQSPKVPTPPAPGLLDVNMVLVSDYFFC